MIMTRIMTMWAMMMMMGMVIMVLIMIGIRGVYRNCLKDLASKICRATVGDS